MNRHSRTLAAACGLWLSLSGCRCGKPEQAVGAPAAAFVADKPALLATLAAEAERVFTFAERGGAVAWAEPEGGSYRVVQNGRAGKPYAAVEQVVLSLDGRRCAYAARVDATWRVVADGVEGKGYSEVQRPVFSPDGAHLVYQARDGEAWRLIIDAASSEPSRTPFQGAEFSADSRRIAFIADADERGFGRLVVSDLAFKAPLVVDGKASGLVVNAERTRGAVASASGGAGLAEVVTFGFVQPAEPRRGPKFEAVSQLAFGPDGRTLAYLGERGGQSFMVLDGKEEVLPPGQYFGPPAIRPDGKAVGIFLLEGEAVRLHQAFLPGGAGQVAPAGGEGLTYSSGGASAYSTNRDEKYYIVVDGKEGPAFDRVVSPRFSPDGRFVVYRARLAGKRFVVVSDLAGKTVRQHPSYEQVFPVQFTADGRAVAYGVKDGLRLRWVVEPL